MQQMSILQEKLLWELRYLHDLLEDGYEQGDIAVIARTNKDLLGLGKLIDAFNMEHQNSEKLRFFKPKYYLYQDSVYQTVLDLLSLHQGILTDDYIWYRLGYMEGISSQTKILYDKFRSINGYRTGPMPEMERKSK